MFRLSGPQRMGWKLGLGEDNDRDLLVFTPVHMDWAEDRHFAEIFSLFYVVLRLGSFVQGDGGGVN